MVDRLEYVRSMLGGACEACGDSPPAEIEQLADDWDLLYRDVAYPRDRYYVGRDRFGNGIDPPPYHGDSDGPGDLVEYDDTDIGWGMK